MATYTFKAPFSGYHNGIAGYGPWESGVPTSDNNDAIYGYHVSGPKDPDPNDVASAGSVDVTDDGAIPSNITAVGNTTVSLRVKTDSLAELGAIIALAANGSFLGSATLVDESNFNNYDISFSAATTRAQMFSYDYGCRSATSNHVGATQKWSRIRVTFSFTLAAPTATTGVATNVTSTSATLNGTVNPNGATSALPVSYYFEYGETDSYGSTTSTVGDLTGSVDSTASAEISGLTSGISYHFRLVATNADNTVFGSDATTGPAGPADYLVFHY